jgi:hypothetical protein
MTAGVKRGLTERATAPTVCEVGLIAGFVIVLGAPVVMAVLVYAAPIHRVAKAVIFGSVPAGIALLLYGRSYSIADVGLPTFLVMVAGAWVLGFLIAPLPLALWHLGHGTLTIRRR